jgi:hypothetical protein
MNLSEKSSIATDLVTKGTIVALFCFPTGLFAVQAAHRMRQAIQSGDTVAVAKEERLAHLWITWSIVLGVFVIALCVALFLFYLPEIIDNLNTFLVITDN